MRVLVFVLKSIIVRILSSKEGNSGENPAYGIGISCKYTCTSLHCALVTYKISWNYAV